jgi:predicted RNase H-like nuclease
LGAGVRERARGNYLKGQVADDDILDAIAALRAATRIAAGEAGTIPGEPPRDSTGLPMEMVY